MGYTLTNKIFGFFGVSAKRYDTYKDVNGKGINERYQESLGTDYDTYVGPLIDDALDKLLVPQTALTKFLIYLEYAVGKPIQLDVDNEALRRKLLWLHNTITLTKGTQISYNILFNLIGINTCTITLIDGLSGFDTGTFDDPDRTFDNVSYCCSHYEVDLLGSPSLDATLIKKIKTILYYLQPVNGEILSLTYNSTTISLP